ncbi:hypothetical protein [Lactiplantibacillus songbeiensis]|uniref:Cell surface protein n=1 Tax=Lactiplantibacillus songbeiensis TaxID=2559920 RepID=A0ABW4C503_9LACO|nr:hypothetical protein [Lactiplantibacillus songbeiensis]
MRKFWQYLLLAVTGLIIMILSPPLISQAKEVAASGLDANSCVIKDARGRVVSHSATLSPDKEYTINYNWKISNTIRIQSGDTVHFYVPANVEVVGDRSFDLAGSGNIGVCGVTSIKSGSHVGLITLNSRLQSMSQRSGFIRIGVIGAAPETPPEPTPTPTPTKPISMTKGVSWVDPTNPTKLNWTIRVNANGNTLDNPVIDDQLSDNQSFVPQSTRATDSLGQTLPVATVNNGSSLSFHLRTTVKRSFKITYQTTPSTPYPARSRSLETFTNAAVYHDDNGHNASANASIDRTLKEPEPTPTEPITMQKSVAWADPGTFTKINWALAISANKHKLVNPVIVDKLSANQSYVDGSVRVTDSAGKAATVSASTNGTEVEFKVTGTFDSDLHVTYQTESDQPSGTETFDNVAYYSDDNQNSATAQAEIDRTTEPTEPEKPGATEPIDMTKTATWADPGKFTKIDWHLVVEPNDQKLANPVIVDTLSPNHSYLSGSAKITDTTGTAVPFTVETNGKVVTFKVTGTYTTALKVSYQTTTDNATGDETFENSAVYHDDNGNTATAQAALDREGPVDEPNGPDETVKPIAMTKLAAWTDPNDQTKINWGLEVAANGNKLVNPEIIDEFTNNQTFVDGSAKASTASGTSIPLTVTVKGSELTFKLSGTFTENLHLTYQTQTTKPTGATIFDNAAIYQDEADNNASAEASIDRDELPVEPEQPVTKDIGMTKNATWADPGTFTKIDWTIKIAANGNDLLNPKITDDSSADLTYVDGSAKVIDSTGKILPVKVTVVGHQLVFTITGKLTHDFTLTYQTLAASGNDSFANAAIYEDDNGNGGSAHATVDRDESDEVPSEPGTTEPGTPSQPQPGTPQPEQPSVPAPETPGKPEPEHPATTTPTHPATPDKKPSVTKPNKPSVTKPSRPSAAKPVKPSAEKPAVAPFKPSIATPTTPIPATATPVTSQPSSQTAPTVTNDTTTNAPAATGTPANAIPSNRLPQTNDHPAIDLVMIGLVSFLLCLLLGSYSFHRHA